jgi:hypothetical protein
MLGLFGYVVAVVAFGYVGIFAGGADAADQLGAGLSAAYLVALVASVAVLVAVLRVCSAGWRSASCCSFY